MIKTPVKIPKKEKVETGSDLEVCSRIKGSIKVV